VLTVSVRIEVMSAEYGSGATTYYTGHRRAVDLSLAAEGQVPIAKSFAHESLPGDYAANFDPTTPLEALEEQSSDVGQNLLDMLVTVWGPAIAIEALCIGWTEGEGPHFEFLATQVLIDSAGIRETMTTAPYPNDYPSWRHWYETGEIVQGEGSGCPVRG
jgi:hypothetical protein